LASEGSPRPAQYNAPLDVMTRYIHGERILSSIENLFPIHRSIAGPGTRKTIEYLQQICPKIHTLKYASGTQVGDWTIPQEWSVREAWIRTSRGDKIACLSWSNLHVISHSEPLDITVDLTGLRNYVHTLPSQPEAIPYLTSYYNSRSGFCIPHRVYEQLVEDDYRLYIDSKKYDGFLEIGEAYLPGEVMDEILLTSYICHPSMVNNELSGPTVLLEILRWLCVYGKRRYSYRILFLPETIGAIAYISDHLRHMQENIAAGYVLTCIGDERRYSYVNSRHGDSLSDRAARIVLRTINQNCYEYSWLDRGSDERQFCAPNVNLPIGSLMRTKYGEFPEYHTSLDDLDMVSVQSLDESFCFVRDTILSIEHNCIPHCTTIGEPQLGKRGLYPTLSTKSVHGQVHNLMTLVGYADGKMDLIAISSLVSQPVATMSRYARILERNGVIVARHQYKTA
jgi:aminopeptidase-like protein